MRMPGTSRRETNVTVSVSKEESHELLMQPDNDPNEASVGF